MTTLPLRLSRVAMCRPPSLPSRVSALGAALLFVCTLALTLGCPAFMRSALAFTPPAIAGMVNDPGNQLTASEKAKLNAKLDGHMKTKGHHIVVFLPKSLEGESIEDVAYATFQAWKVGAAGADNGVLLVIATADRKARIETGKGVGGDLPDLKTNQILRTDVTPNMKVGRVFAAVDQGTSSIITALGGTPGAGVGTKGKPGQPYPFDTTPYGSKKPSSGGGGGGACVCAMVVLPILFFILVVWLIVRRKGGGGGSGGGGGGGVYYHHSSGPDWGSSGSSGSDWGSSGSSGSSGSDWGSSGSDSGGGGSDYGGGGGDSGGGGSSDSW